MIKDIFHSSKDSSNRQWNNENQPIDCELFDSRTTQKLF